MTPLVAVPVSVACLLGAIYLGWGLAVTVLIALHFPPIAAVVLPIVGLLLWSARW